MSPKHSDFSFFDPKNSRPAEIPLCSASFLMLILLYHRSFRDLSWSSSFRDASLSEIFQRSFLTLMLRPVHVSEMPAGSFMMVDSSVPENGETASPATRNGRLMWDFKIIFKMFFFYVFNETGKGYGTQFERHRLEIVFVIESSAWLCLSCRWDQFLLCPRLTHSWCFSGVPKTTTTATTGSYIFFHMMGPICVVFWVEALISFSYEKKLILSRTTTVPVSTLSCISLTNSCLWAHWDLDGLTLFPVSVSPKVVSNRFQRIKDGRHWGAAGKVVSSCGLLHLCVFVFLLCAFVCVVLFYMPVCVCQIMRGYAWEFANHLTGWFFLLITP